MVTSLVIRTMEDARSALAEVLDLPGRTPQIISIMEKIMLTRTAETRRFLTDSMEGLIEGGGLDAMRRKRREALEAAARREAEELEARRQAEEAARAAAAAPSEPTTPGYVPGRRADLKELEAQIKAAMAKKREDTMRRKGAPPTPEPEPEPVPVPAPEPVPMREPVPAAPGEVPTRLLPIVIVPPDDELKDLEELGTEIDALSLAAVAREIFPDLRTQYEPWQVGRAIYMDESNARTALLQGARLKDHERATMLAPALDNLKRLIENHKPWWYDSLSSIRETVDKHFADNPPSEGGANPQALFDVIVMSDERAIELLKLIRKEIAPGVEFVAKLRKRLDDLMEFEAERAS